MCSLDKLLADLDNEDTSVALDAQISLEDRGEEAINPILSLLPSLDFYGQSCALDLLSSWSISLLEAQHNPSVSEVLIPLIRSQRSYVRQWSTYSLPTQEIDICDSPFTTNYHHSPLPQMSNLSLGREYLRSRFSDDDDCPSQTSD